MAGEVRQMMLAAIGRDEGDLGRGHRRIGRHQILGEIVQFHRTRFARVQADR